MEILTDAKPGSPPQRWLYGRRRGRALRPGQQLLRETLMPRLAFALPTVGKLEPGGLFAGPLSALWLEIGYGGGEHLAAQAAAQRDIGFLGAEVFENGIVKLLGAIERGGLGNIRLFLDDGRLLLAALPARAIDRAFILFPDPWPKERHHKRRLVSAATLDELARVMTEGSELRLATDDPAYAQAMADVTAAHPGFRVVAQGRADWAERPADWPPTRYEQKAVAAGRDPLFLRLSRV
jgi:tRNA (guanine-N7-)-methyltransferase